MIVLRNISSSFNIKLISNNNEFIRRTYYFIIFVYFLNIYLLIIYILIVLDEKRTTIGDSIKHKNRYQADFNILLLAIKKFFISFFYAFFI